MNYYVHTWDGDTFFVTTKPEGERFAATFNGITRVSDTPEMAVTRLASHCEWAIKNVMAATPVESFKERVMQRVEALRGTEEFDGAPDPGLALNVVLGTIERTSP